jgi:hypothetical protein
MISDEAFQKDAIGEDTGESTYQCSIVVADRMVIPLVLILMFWFWRGVYSTDMRLPC